jgi:hypothetical protein
MLLIATSWERASSAERLVDNVAYGRQCNALDTKIDGAEGLFRPDLRQAQLGTGLRRRQGSARTINACLERNTVPGTEQRVSSLVARATLPADNDARVKRVLDVKIKLFFKKFLYPVCRGELPVPCSHRSCAPE